MGCIMKEVFAFLRQQGYRTGYWDGTDLTCFEYVTVNDANPGYRDSARGFHGKTRDAWDTIEEHLADTFGEAKRWFHV